MVALLCVVPLPVSAQLLYENRQQKFPKEIPPGNYSGITSIGNDRYAVVSDKTADGFYVFHIDIDTLSGKILSVVNEGFYASGHPNRDQEGITWQPFSRTLYICGESDNQILEYSLDGQQTGRRLEVPNSFTRLKSNYGLESLCYDSLHHLFYTISECPLPGDSLMRLTAFNDHGILVNQYFYPLDALPLKHKGIFVNGVSELCPLGHGRLLVLERTVRVPPMKIGAYVECRLYEIRPLNNKNLQKKLIHSFRTKLNLTRRNYANYEGVCVAKHLSDGRIILILVADSQNQHSGILRDWLKTIIIR